MNLPIDIVPGQWRKFRWKQTFTTPVGTRTIEHTGTLPLGIEDSVAALVNMCKQLMAENVELRQQVRVGIEATAGKVKGKAGK